MAEVPFVGPSYNLDSRPASVQRTVNLIPVPQEPGNERTSWVFKDVPGLVLVQEFLGEPDVLVLELVGDPTFEVYPFDFSFRTSWTGTPKTASPYATWNSGTNKIDISRSGVYEITMTAQIDSNKFSSDVTCIGTSVYGSAGSKSPALAGVSAHHTPIRGTVNASHEQITDAWTLNVATTDSFFPTFYANAYSSTPGYNVNMTVVVRRSGDAI